MNFNFTEQALIQHLDDLKIIRGFRSRIHWTKCYMNGDAGYNIHVSGNKVVDFDKSKLGKLYNRIMLFTDIKKFYQDDKFIFARNNNCELVVYDPTETITELIFNFNYQTYSIIQGLNLVLVACDTDASSRVEITQTSQENLTLLASRLALYTSNDNIDTIPEDELENVVLVLKPKPI